MLRPTDRMPRETAGTTLVVKCFLEKLLKTQRQFKTRWRPSTVLA